MVAHAESHHSFVIGLLIVFLLLVSIGSVAAQDVEDDTAVDLENVPMPTPLSWAVQTSWGRLLLVDLSEFRIYAFEDGELVRSTVVAIGRRDAQTLTGAFTVTRKAEIANLTWRGNTVTDVPYIIVYDNPRAIHGAYWHDDWGQAVSSGCVNLPVDEARWYYDFAFVGMVVVVQA
ncbi:MAG: L,D-transpeptidase [Chloroflexota bacterium]|nr:L,D-transpeptidase [Chloroflexota bacterium]